MHRPRLFLLLFLFLPSLACTIGVAPRSILTPVVVPSLTAPIATTASTDQLAPTTQAPSQTQTPTQTLTRPPTETFTPGPTLALTSPLPLLGGGSGQIAYHAGPTGAEEIF